MESRLLLKEKRKRIHASRPPKPPKSACCDIKLISFVLIGGLTLIYCIVELGAAVYLRSLTLLSDGFHNLSDVVSLYIAFWATQAAKRDVSDSMSYGWVRSEILGGLTNGCFLLSLCLYVVLESIPRFIDPPDLDAGWPFIAVAAGGLAVNTIGTLAFAATGLSHGHSHSHGGHGGHGHGGHGEAAGHGHSHGHGGKKKKKAKHHHEGDEMDPLKKGKAKHKEHGHSHGKESRAGFRIKLDLNMWGVFIHYLGDMISSGVVLVTGIMLHFISGTWTLYIDPAASLVIVALILWTTVPLVKECSMILLQSTPSSISLNRLRDEISSLQGVESVHDLHIWQLAEGKMVGSVHVSVEEGMDFKPFLKQIKGVFHSNGIHSTTVQPEFVPKDHPAQIFCEENCVKDCEEDWCCKKTADRVLRESGIVDKDALRFAEEGAQPVLNGGNMLGTPFGLSTLNGHSDDEIHDDHGHDHDHDHDHGHDHGHDSHDDDDDDHTNGHSHAHGHSHGHAHDHAHDHDDSHDDEDILIKL